MASAGPMTPAWTTSQIAGEPMLVVDHAGSGELLLMLHGTGGCRSNWHDQLPVFGRHFHAVAWDCRGYGDSGDYEGPWLYTDLCADVLRVLRYFGAQRVHLLGLSLGGRIALDFAIRYPGRLHSLILSDADPGVKTIPAQERAQFMASRKAPLLAGRELRDIAPGVADSLAGPNIAAATRERIIDSMSRCRKGSYLKVIDAYDFDRTDDLPRVAARTLVLVGEHDRITPPATARLISSAIPGARMVVVPQAGHLSNMENPTSFNRAVLDFLLDRSPANRSATVN